MCISRIYERVKASRLLVSAILNPRRTFAFFSLAFTVLLKLRWINVNAFFPFRTRPACTNYIPVCSSNQTKRSLCFACCTHGLADILRMLFPLFDQQNVYARFRSRVKRQYEKLGRSCAHASTCVYFYCSDKTAFCFRTAGSRAKSIRPR